MFGLTALTKWHKDILLSCNSWIDDDIISMHHSGNPTCRGLQSTQLAVRFQMEIQKGGFVLVLNINKSHWKAVSSMNCQQSTIKVYDSFHEDTKKLIADIMQSTCPKIEVQYIDVQKQKGQSDCGLFAIAFATLLAHLQDPASITYNQAKMRRHLIHCFETHSMTLSFLCIS